MSPIQNSEQLRAALSIAQQATILVRSMTSEMDAEMAAVKARFEGKIKSRQDEADAAVKAIQVFAAANRDTLLQDGGKSCEINGHTLGWRDNGGAIKMAKGMTEKKLIAKLLKNSALAKLFIRRTPALNKDAMKDKWSTFKARLTALGVRLKHEETFFIELDVTAENTSKGGIS